ncbi:hypothetical protein KC207_12970 [Phycicoccus sp. BSK3Z-2]|uniref:Uncharacterized protein n=1 Tax=Phycicoccus avicenniae TaxID=2828860 RepID=A0A941I1M3_9MICO|nr:hypothetical protein [Phycicoccus avicenniae]MBR7744199.1 hypothetical protein [Phycicoccus avicenniae]
MTDGQRGVVFPQVEGRRSTAALGRAVVADALRRVDPVGAAAAERETNWRSGYPVHFRRLVEAGLGSYGDARTIADAGLAAVHGRMRWSPDGEDDLPLASAVGGAVGSTHDLLDTEVLEGSGEPDTALTVPYRGPRLAGDDLRRQLDTWVDTGVVEPSLRDAVTRVVENPPWLRLEGRTVVVLGAAAEMGPLRSLLRWGATVAAVDLPRPEVWERLRADTTDLAGRLVVPVRAGTGDLTARAGLDLLHDLPTATAWVTALDGPLVLGNYVYADGATNVRVSTAVDAMTEAVRHQRPDTALSFLATPTDVFAVPGEAVAASVDAYAHRRTSKVLRVPLRTVSGGRLLRRNYVPGSDPGVNDSVVPQQGPNYLLAKRIQRWRATSARASGAHVSFTVAPPTRTRSVVKNRALAAAYSGAHRFGVEVFEPGTANTLMAALLVHDLCARPPAQDHPWQDEAQAAAHGGLWRCAYAPGSALGLAAVLGAASRP